jgi:hypothetical protein
MSGFMFLRAPAHPTGFIEPCLPTLARTVPEGDRWAYEVKHDGFRFIARRYGDRVAGVFPQPRLGRQGACDCRGRTRPAGHVRDRDPAQGPCRWPRSGVRVVVGPRPERRPHRHLRETE